MAATEFSRAGSRVEMRAFSDTAGGLGEHKRQQDLEDGEGVSSWNVGESSHLDAAVCPRKFHWHLFVIKLLKPTGHVMHQQV